MFTLDFVVAGLKTARAARVFAVLALLVPGSLQPQTLTTEYIHAGSRVIATIHTPPAYFTDPGFLPAGGYSQFLSYANLMKAEGITGGTSANTFSPGLVLTRDNAAVFIIRAIYVALLGPGQGDNFTLVNPLVAYFTDVPTTSPYFKWIQKMHDLNITGGCSTNLYCPTADTTNAGMAVFTIRAHQYVLTGGVLFSYPPTPQLFLDEPNSDLYYSFVQAIGGAPAIGGLGVVPPATGSFGCLPAPNFNFCAYTSISRAAATAYVVHGILNDWSF